MQNTHELKILALNSGMSFATKLCEHMNRLFKEHKLNKTISPIDADEVLFDNGEVKVVINESVRGEDVYIVQLFDDPCSKRSLNDNLMAAATAANAAYYSDSYRLTMVMPQFPYARQDKRRDREPLTAKIVGNLLEYCGVKRVITLDIHSEGIESSFNHMLTEDLHMSPVLIQHLKNNVDLSNIMVVAPDVGSAKRGVFFAKKLKTDLAIIHKIRDYSKPSTIGSMSLVGDVTGKDILICDDMLASGGTILRACKLLKESGAKDIYISIALPYFSKGTELFKKAYQEGVFKKIIGTNAVGWGDKLKDQPWYQELDVTGLYAEVIFNLNNGESVSKLLV